MTRAVEVTKDGKFGLTHIGPIVRLKVGMNIKLGQGIAGSSEKITSDMLSRIVELGYGKEIEVDSVEPDTKEAGDNNSEEHFDGNIDEENEESSEEQEEKEPEIKDLMDLLKGVTDENKKKTIIQDWGEINLGIKVTKSKSVNNMISEIKDNLG